MVKSNAILPFRPLREFATDEVELKFNVLNIHPSQLIKLILKDLEVDSIVGYTICPWRTNQYWSYNFDYYGYFDSHGLEVAYHLVSGPDAQKHWLRKKYQAILPKLPDSSWYHVLHSLVRRSEFQQIVYKPITEELKAYYQVLESSQAGRIIHHIGTVNREKFYFYCYNHHSLRHYSIGADLCSTTNGSTMSQLEIEYKWRAQAVFSETNSYAYIYRDFFRLAEFLLDKYKNNLTLTSRTKLEWLVDVLR